MWKSNESTRGRRASVIADVVLGLIISIKRPVLLSVFSIAGGKKFNAWQLLLIARQAIMQLEVMDDGL